jgi:predicted  nucleic acid-binding Zn-ribbon protein
MKNLEKIAEQVELAEAKRKVLEKNIRDLTEKEERIKNQIAAQRRKIEKIDYFLNSCKKTEQGTNPV